MAEADRLAASGGPAERTPESVRRSRRLPDGILDEYLSVIADGVPPPRLRVVADGAAFHLKREHAVVRMGDDEVRLALFGASIPAGQLPRDRVERRDVVGCAAARPLEEP